MGALDFVRAMPSCNRRKVNRSGSKAVEVVQISNKYGESFLLIVYLLVECVLCLVAYEVVGNIWLVFARRRLQLIFVIFLKTNDFLTFW